MVKYGEVPARRRVRSELHWTGARSIMAPSVLSNGRCDAMVRQTIAAFPYPPPIVTADPQHVVRMQARQWFGKEGGSRRYARKEGSEEGRVGEGPDAGL